MGLVQDMALVVKTLQEAHNASLLQDGDDDPLSFSESDEDPLKKQSRSKQILDKQPVLTRQRNQLPTLVARWTPLSLK